MNHLGRHSNDSRPVVFLLATAGFVLLLTCANLANLQLVRGLVAGIRRTLMSVSHRHPVLQ